MWPASLISVCTVLLFAGGCAAPASSSAPVPFSADVTSSKPNAILSGRSLGLTYGVLFSFPFSKARFPSGPVLVAPGGALYGTSSESNSSPCGCGAVFKVTSKTAKETVLHNFAGGSDGDLPENGVIRDTSGSLYGTTKFGGDTSCEQNSGQVACGTVYKLTPSGSGGTYTESILHRFHGGNDGINPDGGLLLASDGKLYGTTAFGGGGSCNSGGGCGTIFRLSTSGDGYTVLYAFTGKQDGSLPSGVLLEDADDNFYGTTVLGGSVCDSTNLRCGTVFELSSSASGFTESIIYRFQGSPSGDGAEPQGGLITYGGNFYGTTWAGGKATCSGGDAPIGCGTIYELKKQSGSPRLRVNPSFSDRVLYDFDPAPYTTSRDPSSLFADGVGNLYGATDAGGGCSDSDFIFACGTLFELSASGSFNVIHAFEGPPDGALGDYPLAAGSIGLHRRLRHSVSTTGTGARFGGLAISANGTVYGATSAGGTGGCEGYGYGCGTIYYLEGLPSARKSQSNARGLR